jgi:hypothetical protein
MKKRTLTILVAALLMLATAWARDDRMHNTSISPAAQGAIESSNDRSGNTKIHVTVKHMADPGQLAPAQTAYFVWVQPRGEAAQAVGKLRVNKDLEGSIDTVVPAKVFDVFITAESSDKPDAPSSMEVLRGTVDRKD